ncbi:5-nucleotidase SurE [Candidatus Rhodobacter oscarellae]|uniref:5'-nucleotidase SurE n=1 Tax=Candidatus Rhodobacter oscarellae TaxID=1675527 RepID=A0A0J9E9K9_9RHOB|nr:5'/3'-nucleotidase SurE [Candidatus Rhodobacter lobularis]KMW58354.1 5-nucleotidase SurE [Candidatus Rhodobacter lobularis]
MRILITNDDGIDAPGIKIMEAVANEIAGAAGEVWVVAPSFERSGVGHCVSYTNPARIAERGPRRFEVEGFPADCVLAGIYDVLGGAQPDLILSGVNRGNNSAENTLYSGTIGAAMEGALQGCKAIALSQFYGPANNAIENPFDAAAQTGAQVIRDILAADSWGADPYPIFYNVNFPPVPAAQVKGTRVVAQGRRPGVRFSANPHEAPNGRKYLWIGGGAQAVESGPDTDCTVNIAGYTSVTPMRCDLTAHDALDALKATLG